MSGGADSNERYAKDIDLRAPAKHDTASPNELANAEWVSASELRTIAPDEIQILAATGC